MVTGLGADLWEDFHVVIKPVTLYGNSYRLNQIPKSVTHRWVKSHCSKGMCLILLSLPLVPHFQILLLASSQITTAQFSLFTV